MCSIITTTDNLHSYHAYTTGITVLQIDLDSITIDEIVCIPKNLENRQDGTTIIAVEMCGSDNELKTIVLNMLNEYFRTSQKFKAYMMNYNRSIEDYYAPVIPHDILHPNGLIRGVVLVQSTVLNILDVSRMNHISDISIIGFASNEDFTLLKEHANVNHCKRLLFKHTDPSSKAFCNLIKYFRCNASSYMYINLDLDSMVCDTGKFGKALLKTSIRNVFISANKNIQYATSLVAQIVHMPDIIHIGLINFKMTQMESMILMSILSNAKHLQELSFYSMWWSLPEYIDLYDTLGSAAKNLSVHNVHYAANTRVNMAHTTSFSFKDDTMPTRSHRVLQPNVIEKVTDLCLIDVAVNKYSLPQLLPVFTTKTIPIQYLALDGVTGSKNKMLAFADAFSPMRSLTALTIFHSSQDAQTLFPFVLKMIERNVALRSLCINLPGMNGMLTSILIAHVAKYLPNISMIDIRYNSEDHYRHMAFESIKTFVSGYKSIIHVTLYKNSKVLGRFSNIFPANGNAIYDHFKVWSFNFTSAQSSFKTIHKSLTLMDTFLALHKPIHHSNKTNKRIRA